MLVRSKNWPLILGITIASFLVLLALAGPLIAPHDPLARTLVAVIGGQRRGVPFPPFGSWEFPFGSDRFGRDLYSRLLWAFRPTLLLVAIVGGIRLILGLVIGMLAGWGRGSASRGLSMLIDGALSVPILVVALATIAAVGIERGLIAFIAGMALTGWAETAQTVRAQTQLVAAQPYIQSARALGATGPQIIIRHISRHIATLVGMLLAFEISATLMLTAALAFMGYFIGGGQWIIVSGEVIPVAERVAGLPELGQLIGTAQVRISSQPPWEMIFPGLAVFVAILGFTLLGEGLRRRQSHMVAGQPGLIGRLFGSLGQRIEEAALHAAGRWNSRLASGGLYGIAAVGLLLFGGFLWQQRPAPATRYPGSAIVLSRAVGWAAERGDSFGTLHADQVPAETPRVAWEFAADAGLSGGPAVASDGTIYVAGMGGRLYAIAPDGAQRWSSSLAGEPVGAPALGSDGTIYVVDRKGGLSAFAANGEPRWHFQSSYRPEGTSGPIVGPDGTIYYAVLDGVQAVSAAGEGRWVGSDRGLPYQELLPRLSPDASIVFLKSSAFSATDGSRLVLDIVPDEPVYAEPTFLTGADGRAYYRSEHRIIPWRPVEAGIAIQPALGWSANNVFFMPSDTGVTTAGIAWMLYTTEYADTRLVWIGPEGALLGESFFALRQSRAIATTPDGTILLCGSARNRRLNCAAYRPESGDTPLWQIELPDSGAIALGGAVVDGRIYIATEEGKLVALE